MSQPPSSTVPLPERHPLPAVWIIGPLLVLAAAARVVFALTTGTTYEDALISLRYAENLASGLGLVYNAGEPVFGASTPLHVLLLAGFAALNLPALAAAKLLTGAADLLTLALWLRWLLCRGNLAGALLLGLFLALSPMVVPVSVSGMETSFAVLFLTLALLHELDPGPAGGGWLLGLWLGLLALVRPDGLLAAAVVLGIRWVRTRRAPWVPALSAGLVLLPWIVGATLYYGSPLPNSIPAKVAAYNFHIRSPLPNLWATLAELAPTRLDPPGRTLVGLVLAPCLLAGLVRCLRDGELRLPAALFLVWWAYLVLPRTYLFPWYFPLLMLPAAVTAAVGADALLEQIAAPRRPLFLGLTAALFAAGLVQHLFAVGSINGRLQAAEVGVRKELGLWLRQNTPPEARIAMEPLGYVGYYSRRRILDEVGLVSPEMIPLNREGAGWFDRMLERFRPEYVVERPCFLFRNQTVNSKVPMFRDGMGLERFARDYQAVAAFQARDLPRFYARLFRFTVYRRRTPEEAAAWERRLTRLPKLEREVLVLRAVAAPLPNCTWNGGHARPGSRDLVTRPGGSGAAPPGPPSVGARPARTRPPQ